MAVEMAEVGHAGLSDREIGFSNSRTALRTSVQSPTASDVDKLVGVDFGLLISDC